LPEALGRAAVRRVDISVRRANGWRKKSGCHRIFAFSLARGRDDHAPWGAIRVIGATTTREYRQTIEKDGALERRFQAVRIEEPSADEAVAILLALRPRLEAHHGVALEEAALRAAVEWSVRYLPDFRLPDKALDGVDQACAAVRFGTLSARKSCGETPQGRPAAGRSSHDVTG
jgi:AAA lid domain